jgi:hypothetical protein
MLKRSESIEDRATDSGLLESERKLIDVIGFHTDGYRNGAVARAGF